MRLGRKRRNPQSQWMGTPTLRMGVKDHPKHPDVYLSHHRIQVAPVTREDVALVSLWIQSGSMLGTALLSVDDARSLSRALIEAAEQAHAHLGKPAAEPEPDR